MVKKREKNTFHFQSFNDQLSGIKVGVRRLTRTEDCDEGETQTNQSLQYWREMNCSEQFVTCYGKLNTITESLPQLLHHKDKIVDIILESLQDTRVRHGCDAVLDVLSHLALDLQQDFYSCVPRVIPVLHSLLKIQDAPLICHVFKTFAHLFKTTWRQMLADIDSVFDLLSPLFTPPTKHYISTFMSESFAYLIRKHPNPAVLLELMEKKVEEDSVMVGPAAALLFETVKGVQYKFNTHAEVYLSLILKRSVQSKHFQDIYIEMLKLVVIKITKPETQIIWDSLIKSLSENQNGSPDYLIFLLSSVDVMLKGGRHTYLISSSDILTALTPIFKLLGGDGCGLEEKLSETTQNFISAHNHLMKYLKQMVSSDDCLSLSLYLDNHKSVRCLQDLVSVLCQIPEFYDKYCPVILDKVQNLDMKTYVPLLADIAVHSETNNILDIPGIFSAANVLFKQSAVKLTSESISDETLVFKFLKVIQNFQQVDETSLSTLTDLCKTFQKNSHSKHIYLELVKCVTLLSGDKKTELLCWEEVVEMLTKHSDNVVVLQTVYFYLRQTAGGFVNKTRFEIVMDLLKDNLLKTSSSVRYITLKILSLYTSVEDIASTTRQDIAVALSAETTPLSLDTYRDKLMFCSQLRYSNCVENTEFKVRYLLGSLQWPLRPIWEGLTKLIVEFGNCNSAVFWTIFSQIIEGVYSLPPENTVESEDVASQYAIKIANSNFSNAGLLVKDIDESTFRIALWNLLSEIPQIAEPKSRHLVPIILDFREKYNNVYGFRKQDISLERSEKPGGTTAGSSKRETHINDELRAMLKLLSLFNNPKSLYKTAELQVMYSELLSNKQTDVQKLALECVLTYKEPALSEYKDELLTLVDDVNFRDQLSKFSVSGEGTILKSDHRTVVFPVLLKIMFGKMGSRIGHAKGKAGSKQRQGIVLRYLEACSEVEISLFFELVGETFGIRHLISDFTPSFSITPLGMQTSYLRLVRQTISVLHEDQTRPHVTRIVDTVLTLLQSVQHCLQHRAAVQPHTHTPLKALRALAISTLTHIFNSFPKDDLSAHQSRVYPILVDLNIVNLPAESLQSSSPLLIFIESCAMYRLSWLQHTCADKHVLEYVTSLLHGKGVVSSVISKVLTIITCLLDHGAEGQSLILPHLTPVVKYIHLSLLSLKKNKKKVVGVSSKKTLKQELHLLSRISCLITEIPQVSFQTSCDALISTLVHVLKEQIVRKPTDVVNAVNTVSQLLLYLKKSEYPSFNSLQDSCYKMCSVLLGENNDRYARGALCALLTSTEHPTAKIVQSLNSWNTTVLDEPDYDARLQGYRDMSQVLRADLSDVRLRLSPCLSTALYTVFTSEEMALRDSASNAVILSIDFVKSSNNSELYSFVVEDNLAKFIQSGLRNPSEVFQREAVVLLHKVVQTFTEIAPWQHLGCLADEDPETDFFNNITHIQTHRRTRAVARMHTCVEVASVDVIWNYLLPILSPIFSLSGNKHHNTISEGLSVLTELSARLPWSKFLKLLLKSLKDLAAKVEDKNTVKVVGAILAGFHETVEPGSKILTTISTRVLPKMLEFLTKKTLAPVERSRKKSIAYEEDQVAVQAPIAIAIVNLITRLPEEEKQSKLPPVLLRICNTLRNRAMDVRDTSRQTLSTIANNLGPLYLGYILSELRGALSKGYQLHVLAYTLHHLLIHLDLKPADIDNSALQTISEICVDGLVGRTAADRDRGNDNKNTLPEAKKCYTSQCLERIAGVLAVSQLPLLMDPVKKMVLETTKSKTISKLEDLLKCLVSGLLKNPLITPTVSMVFCYQLLNESIAFEKSNKATPTNKTPTKTDIYQIPEAPKRDGIKPKLMRTSNIHLLHQFSLQLLSTLLKRGVVTSKEQGELLDPFVDSLAVCLNSADVKTQVLAVRCFSQLFEQSVLLPKLCSNVSQLTKFSFHVLRNNTRSTNSGHMLELIFSSFKILTVILREYKDFSLSELEVKTLLTYIADDIHNRNRQATAFSLLKSILSRDIVLPEIPELLERIFELSVVGQSDFVRTQSRHVFLHYLLHYPLGKKLRTYLISLTNQLEYTHKDGRMSALELLGMVITKLPPDLLKEYFLVVFLALSTMLVSDVDAECRKGAAITIEQLVNRAGNDNLKDKVWNLTSAWLADKKLKHKYLAVLLIESLSKHLTRKRAAVLIEQLIDLVNTLSVWEGEEDNVTSTRDQAVYTGVLTLLKLDSTSTLPLTVYDRLQELMTYPHQWVRLAGSQLLGHLLSGHDYRNVLSAGFSSSAFGNNPRLKMDELIKLCLVQLRSGNILPEHSLQIVKNIVWLTAALLFSGQDEEQEGMLSTRDVIHRIVVFASVESSQNPNSSLKRGIVLKWVGALVKTVDKELIAPHLPVLVSPVHREVKNTEGPACEIATEVMSFLRDHLGNEILSSALVTATKTQLERKKKRKRETALAAIADPESRAKKKVKVNLAKREKRKEKYKMLKAKQFKSH
ncbi:hypothetical protein ACHWQZ_G003559 [Mnemiopsis leidyi]